MALPVNYVRRVVGLHNRFQGYAAMTRRQMMQIQRSGTATERAIELAAQIEQLSILLADELRTRVDDPELIETYEKYFP